MRNEAALDRAAQAAARAKANADFLSNQEAERTSNEVVEVNNLKSEEFTIILKRAGKIGLIVGGAIIVGYIVYKTAPRIKEWWEARKRKLMKKTVLRIKT